MNRILFFVHYNKYNGLSDHVVYLLERIKRLYTRVVFISNSPLSEEQKGKLAGLYHALIFRENKGFDFGAWKDALLQEGWEALSRYDSVTLMNDTCFGPFFDMGEVYDKMERQDCDFWGLTSHRVWTDDILGTNRRIPEHVQSYFSCFNKRALSSRVFHEFWSDVEYEIEREKVVQKYETQLTRILADEKLRWSVFIDMELSNNPQLHPNASVYHPDMMIKNHSPLLKIKSFLFFSMPSYLIKAVEDTTDYPVRFIYDYFTDIYDPNTSQAALPKAETPLHLKRTYQSGFYFDTGNGFNNDEKVHLSFNADDDSDKLVYYEIALPDGTKAVRFNPVEDAGCLLYDLEIISLSGALKFEVVNGVLCENGDMLFTTSAPHLLIHGGRRWLKLWYKIIPFTDIAHFHLIENYRKSHDVISELKILLRDKEAQYEAEIEKLTKEKEAAQDERDYHSKRHSLVLVERDALQSKLSSVEAAFNSVINSEFWRITKPARVAMDATKSILKRLPLIKYLYKFMAHWKNFGFKSAIAKIKAFSLRKKCKSHKNYQILSIKEYKRQRNTRFEKKIKFSILTPLYNTPEKLLVEMIKSVKRQTYKGWELCLADGSDGRHGYVEDVCKRLSRKDKRILYKKLEGNLGISGNTNVCIDMSTGDYIGLLDHDDTLHPSALFEAMKVICEKNADVIYTDEDKIDAEGKRYFDPHFKPDFAIDNLRAYNYICHFLVFKKELLNKVGRFDSRYDGAQDYDLTLRLTEQAGRIAHIPKVLYHWRVTTGSTAFNINTKTYAIKANIGAVESHLKRCGLNADVVGLPIDPTVHKVVYKLLDKPLVSIIIPNKDHAPDLEKCVSSIERLTNYSNYEIVIIENNSELEETFLYYEEIKKKDNIRIVVYNGGFNYSKINNFGVKHTGGEYVMLLNNDIEIISSCWIEEMLMLCQRDDVGAVGAKLYYYDNTIQHGGVIVGVGGVAGHSHKSFPGTYPGYFLRLSIQQDLSAVTAACMMVKRKVFDEIEGFNSDFTVAFNDIDLCMRIRKAGYLIAWTPFAEAYHYESKSRGYEDTPEKQERFRKEADLFQRLWSKELSDGDPYYNVNLTLDREDFSFA